MMRRNTMATAATGCATLAVLLVSMATAGTVVRAVPTSVLADSKAANDVTTAPGLNQLTTDDATYGDDKPSNPQKRGVNPLLYREAELRNDFSGNSIPQNGVWEDVEGPLPNLAYPLELLDAAGDPTSVGARTYDVLQGLLLQNRPSYNPLLVAGHPPMSAGFPALRLPAGGTGPYPYGERKKRTAAGPTAPVGKSHAHLMRLKRNSGKLSPAEVFSLLALMDARDPYRPMPPLADYAPLDTPTGDLLAYGPNGLYADAPFPLALDQLLGGGRMAATSGLPQDGYAYEDAGEWMNGWTDPSVDYMGLPMADLDMLGSLADGKSYGPSNGYLPQKRFMVAKRKRSVSPSATKGASDCKAGDAACGSFQHGTIQAAA